MWAWLFVGVAVCGRGCAWPWLWLVSRRGLCAGMAMCEGVGVAVCGCVMCLGVPCVGLAV